MAYKLKYYKSIESQGHDWRLEIHQDTNNAIYALEIGPVLQGLKLIVQGDQADVDTPIVKTSLEMVFVDAPDLENWRKCGYWEEFYTSSATEYKVKLFKDNILEWTGFITPDSFSESLQYRGAVAIIARDNLGSLQDYEYDATSQYDGMQSIARVIDTGLSKISFPMSVFYTYKEESARKVLYPQVEGIASEVWRSYINNKSLNGKTWQEAIESLLYATGMVLRYVGGNTFALSSIRDLPLYGYEYHWDVPILDATFCAFGHRELAPAVKSIVDEVSFEIENNLADVDVPADAYKEEGSYVYYEDKVIQDVFLSYEMPVFAVKQNSWSAPEVSKSLFLNPFNYALKEGFSSQRYGDLRSPDVVYLASNPFESNERLALWQARTSVGSYVLSFKLDTPVALYDDNKKIGFTDFKMELSKMSYYLRWRSDDGIISLEYRESQKGWVLGVAGDPNSFFPSSEQKGFPYTFEFPEVYVDRNGTFEIEIHGFIVSRSFDSPGGVSKGAYVQVKDMTLKDVALENSSIPQSLKVTTNYSAKNNIRIQRNASFGFNMGQISSPKVVVNGLYIDKDQWYKASDEWKFNANDIPQPLSVMLHKQLLAYYSKPNNVLTGELATSNPLFNALYEWNEKKHLLTSGSLNIISGRMENVILREFTRYDYMWETSVSRDAFNLSGNATQLKLEISSKKTLSISDVVCPSWITPELKKNWNGDVTLYLYVEANPVLQERSAIVKIDTAMVLVKQAGPRDYSADYGNDYC